MYGQEGPRGYVYVTSGNIHAIGHVLMWTFYFPIRIRKSYNSLEIGGGACFHSGSEKKKVAGQVAQIYGAVCTLGSLFTETTWVTALSR